MVFWKEDVSSLQKDIAIVLSIFLFLCALSGDMLKCNWKLAIFNLEYVWA